MSITTSKPPAVTSDSTPLEMSELISSISTHIDEARLGFYIIFGLTALLIAIVQIIISVRHKASAYELERRKASNEAIRDYVVGEAGVKVNSLKLNLDKIGCKDYLWDHENNIDIVLKMKDTLMKKETKTEDELACIEAIKTIHALTVDLLNYYEYLANGVESQTMNEEILHNFYAVILIDFRRWSEPLVCEDADGIMPWTQYAELADKWEKEFTNGDGAIDEQMDYLKRLRTGRKHKKLKPL